VHFLMMTFGEDGSDFANADHVHVDQWDSGAASPIAAATQMQVSAHGGPVASWEGRSNYGFLDGHAKTLRFEQVYTDYYDNAFFPEVAR
jgi:prepilin-type processing-associated H-X9-DG protein